ncbi:hypothetical protein D9M69_388330 [compost metagenome]
MNAVQIELAVLEQQQSCGLARQDLATQLRTDRTTSTGYQYGLTTNATLEQLLLRRNRITSEQVNDVHFLDVINLHSPTGQIHKTRHTAHMQRKLFQVLQHLTPTRAGGRGDRQQDLLRPRFLDHLLNVLGLEHPQPGDYPIGNTAVVIDERHRTHRAPHTQGTHQLVTGSPGAINRHPGQTVITVHEWHRVVG